MLSYVSGTGTVPLLGDTIGAALNRTAARFGDRDALISCQQNIRYSYAELLDLVDRAARAFLALGVRKGDRIGIWSANRAEWPVTQYAAAKVGAILVNINPSYRLRELEYALNQSGVSVLVAARTFRKTDYVEMLTNLMPELTSAGGDLLATADHSRLALLSLALPATITPSVRHAGVRRTGSGRISRKHWHRRA